MWALAGKLSSLFVGRSVAGLASAISPLMIWLVVFILGAATGWMVCSWKSGLTLTQERLDRLQVEYQNVKSAQENLTKLSSDMAISAYNLMEASQNVTSQTAQIRNKLQAHITANPINCRYDDFRVQQLQAAREALTTSGAR